MLIHNNRFPTTVVYIVNPLIAIMPLYPIATPMFYNLDDANRFARKLVVMYRDNAISEQEYSTICIQILKSYTALKTNKLVRHKSTRSKAFKPIKTRLCKMSK